MTDPIHAVVTPLPETLEALATDADGKASHTYAWPSGMPTGTEIYYQVRVVDPGGSAGEALSNTIRATAP